MAVIYVDLETEYLPKTEDQDINVSVKTGDGQGGSWLIYLDQDLKNCNGDATIGNKDAVENKDTTVIVTIKDKLEQTNWTSITITFTEGPHKTTFGPYKKLVPKHRDTAIYTIKFSHK